MLRDIASPDTALSRISVAINWIRQNFAETIRVEALAEMAALSVSAFHRHFEARSANGGPIVWGRCQPSLIRNP
jgi:transcriptional regulator GlxA family with amidase domain